MLFNSLEFLVVFLPLTFAAYHLAPARLRLVVVIFASLVFYGVAGIVPLIFLLASILWGFGAAFLLPWLGKRWGILVAISFPLLVLYSFKYLGFTLDTIGAGAETRDAFFLLLGVTLPAGISFYTFQIMCYSIDVADGEIEVEHRLMKLAAYVSLFPQLIAGPIVRYRDIRPQLTVVTTNKWLRPDVKTGLKFLSFGLCGKIFFADTLNIFVNNRLVVDFATQSTPLDALYICLAYSFRIYFDFWAYSLMAIGLGKLFCIDLPINFREPYLARNPKVFWRCWHVTLSNWLRDYVYIKLGGNKRYIRNIIIVFAAVGLWHGAGWNFVVWGLYHAALVIGYNLVQPLWDRMPNALQVAGTFALVTLGWPLFFATPAEYAQILLKMIGLLGTGDGIYGLRHWMYLSVVALWTFCLREDDWLYNKSSRPVFDWPAVHAVALFVGMIFISFSSTFIYFRF